jgi:hypothetical protein
LIEDKAEVVQFVDEFATANVFCVVISSVAKGRTSAEFRVGGPQRAIDAVSANCPSIAKNVTGDVEPTRSTSKLGPDLSPAHEPALARSQLAC